MKSITELIKKECFFVDFERCYLTEILVGWSVALYVQIVVWYNFVIASIVIVKISTFILSPSDISVVEKIDHRHYLPLGANIFLL
jgi:hypothetical protein